MKKGINLINKAVNSISKASLYILLAGAVISLLTLLGAVMLKYYCLTSGGYALRIKDINALFEVSPALFFIFAFFAFIADIGFRGFNKK